MNNKTILMRPFLTLLVTVAFIAAGLTSCKKDWLDAKPQQSLTVPTTISDFQGVLDDIGTMNVSGFLLEIGADDHYTPASVLPNLSQLTITSYLWAYEGWGDQADLTPWSATYTQIFKANLVMEGLSKIPKDQYNTQAWNNVYGSALFYRAFAYNVLLHLFAKQYNPATAGSDLGVPLRLEANVSQIVGRSSIQKVYDQIISDLIASKDLLPVTPQYKTRPSKPAVFALFARMYLFMQDYPKAFQNADACLQMYKTLLDYNSRPIQTSQSTSAFPPYDQNPEIIFYETVGSSTALTQANATIDSVLYPLYAADDLRLAHFFRTVTADNNRKVWMGSYTQAATSNFHGLAVDEMYLIRAECQARAGDYVNAMKDLDTLLVKRWKTNKYVPTPVANADQALVKILLERRKELTWRGLRWLDLRRLNNDSRFAKTILHFGIGQTITLLPNDNKYVWPIPNSEILFSGIEQNPR
jgi:hypothetical protein